MNEYYIFENKIFSDKETEISFFQINEDIETETSSKDLYKANKEIIDKLKTSLKNKKTMKIYGIIEKDFIKIREEIEKLDKSKLGKVEEDNYKFMEKVSGKDILNQLIMTYEDDEKCKRIDEKINIYIDKKKPEEEQKLKDYDDQVIKLTQIRDKIKEEREEFYKENIDPVEKEIKKLEKETTDMEKKKEKLEESLKNENTEDKDKNKLELIETKIAKEKQKIEDLEIEIKIIQAKIHEIKDKMRSGISKCPNPILMILTLGLIYWTKSSECKYRLVHLSNKINRKKIHILARERKIKKYEREKDAIEKKDKQKNIENTKKIEKINKEIEDIQSTIPKNKKEIEKNTEAIKRKKKEIEKLEKDFEGIELKIKECEELKNKYNENSLKKIKKEYEIIEKEYNESINKMIKTKNSISSQTTKIDGSWIVKL